MGNGTGFAWPHRRGREEAQGKMVTDSDKERHQLLDYMHGKRYEDARNQSDRIQVRFWRSSTFGSAATSAILAAVVWHLCGKQQYVPYVIETDAQHRIVNTEILREVALSGAFTQQKVIEDQLSNWVMQWRTVTADRLAQKSIATRVFAMVDKNSSAKQWLMNWYQTHDPVEKAKTSHVEAMVLNRIPQSLTTYEMYWQETETTMNGISQVSKWRCVLTITISPPKDETEVKNNPFAIFVTNISEPRRETSNE